MTIQFNTDNNITGSEKLREPIIAMISDELNRFSDHITRIEVHISDENGKKQGLNDKKCVLEARVEGKQPIAVTSHGDTIDQAVGTAIDKLKSSLDSIMGRLKTH
jgi:ribosome-associated translation inhibitor RaiA